MMASASATVPLTSDRTGPGFLRTAAFLSVAGFAGITVLSGLYTLVPPEAAAPAVPFDAAAAIAGARSAAGLMHAMSLLGIVADVVAAIGVFLLVLEAARRNNGVAAAGWVGVFLSIVVFLLVDTVVGLVLPPLAETDTAAFIGLKRLFDALFLAGSVAFGIGALAALAGEWGGPSFGLSRAATVAGLVVGAGTLVTATACLAGYPVHLAVGASIGSGALVFTWIAVELARACPDESFERRGPEFASLQCSVDRGPVAGGPAIG